MGNQKQTAKQQKNYTVIETDEHGEWEAREFKRLRTDPITVVSITDDDTRVRLFQILDGEPIAAALSSKHAPLDVSVDILTGLVDVMDAEANDETGHQYAEYPSLVTLRKFLRSRLKEDDSLMKEVLATGLIAFDNLRRYFMQNREIVIGDGDDAIGGRVVAARNKTTWMGGRYLEVIYEHIAINTNGPTLAKKTAFIGDYDGLRKVAELPIRAVTDAIKNRLTERGKVFRLVTAGAGGYMHYEGVLTRRSWWSDTEYRAQGRVMVDLPTMRRIDPDYFNQSSFRFDNDRDDNGIAAPKYTIKDEDLWRCDKTIFGFSFTAKRWGEMNVSHLSDIEFKTEAFDQLVLDPTVKKQILALVKNSAATFTDVISGKGGGSIFLLAGPPGVGKTLTAEAVSEILKRPLYSVSVGELGTAPDQLEERLRIILDVARAWNAVILLDEADIFLARRDEKDILRNAMVGVFLRLLEYHQGVLFLTTNRAHDIDEAFNSRISLSLHYDALSDTDREKVWTNLLKAAGVTGVDPHAMAHYHINGRQIKNTIRLAQALAREDGPDVKVSASHLEQVLRVAEKFQASLKGAAE